MTGGALGTAGGALAGAKIGAGIGAGIDVGIMLAKKVDIKQVDQAIRKALGRKPTDQERGDLRDYIHQEKADGQGDFGFKDLVRLAKELFGGER